MTPPPPPPDTHALRMLFVEDNRLNTVLFEEAMRMRGDIELRCAETGEEALACLEDGWTPQVLVLDANLPDTTGYELLLRLRARPGLADTPAFMCSADAYADDLARAQEAGFAGYWTKPVDLVVVHADIDARRLRLGLPVQAR